MTLRSPSHRIAPTAAERPSKALTAVQAPCSGDNPEDHSTSILPAAPPGIPEKTIDKPNEVEHAAILYASMGWALLPVRPADKVPALRDWPNKATRDPENIHQWFQDNPDYNIGIATGEKSDSIIVIDLDVKSHEKVDGTEIARVWQMSHGQWPHTVTSRTGGGGQHFFFRVPRPIPGSVNRELGVDIRAQGSQAILPPSVHSSGSRYYWDVSPCDCEVADANESVLEFIKHVTTKKSKDRWEEKPEVLEGYRDEELFKACSSWQSQGLSNDVILEKALEYNMKAFNPPLSDGDVMKKVDSVVKRYEKGQGGEQAPKSHIFNHARFSKRILIEKHMCFIGGAPAVWEGSCYRMGWKEVEKAMLDLDENIKSNNRNEVIKYLDLSAPKKDAADSRYIAFTNGVLDINDMILRPISPDLFIPNIIPHRWNPDARTNVVCTFLEGVSCGDKATMSNLMETIGLCMYRGTELGACLVLKGEGSNGKSTFIGLLHAVLGADNVSALDMKNIGDRFQTVPLMGKLANLGDDIANETIRGSCAAIIKKIVTGEAITAEYKGAETIFFNPYCTLVFSCNEIPELGDSSQGMLRRMHPISFNARFDTSSPNFDPYMSEKLKNEDVCEAAIVLGIMALRDCIKRKGLTPNLESRRMLQEIQTENDSVLSWAIDERGYGKSDQTVMVGRVIPEERSAYENWCLRAGIPSVGTHKFTRRINTLFGTVSKSTTREYTDGYHSVRVFGGK